MTATEAPNKKRLHFTRRDIREFILLNIGTLLVTAGVYFFKFPNNFSTGGVSGISVILAALIPGISAGTLVLIINMLLLILAFIIFGKGFGFKTAYSSMLMSLVTRGLEILYPMDAPFTDEPLLELFFAVLLPAVGSALLFNMNASTGGTDIVAMIMKKLTHLNIGKALLLSDILITVAACFVFGMKTGLFSIFGLLVKSLLLDSVLESFNTCKYFTIVTTEAEAICGYISKTIHRGATISDCKGAFTNSDKKMIFTVMGRQQAVQLREFVRSVDPHAFIMITNTSEIIGKGFRGI